jgi:hypothetical protein
MSGWYKGVALLSAAVWIAADLLVGLMLPVGRAFAQLALDVPYYAANIVPPNVLIILDKSGSMGANSGGTDVGNLDGNACDNYYTVPNPCTPSPPNIASTRLDVAYRVLYDILNADASTPSGQTTSFPKTEAEADSSSYINNITTADQTVHAIRLGFAFYGPTGNQPGDVSIVYQIQGNSSNDPLQNNFGFASSVPAYQRIWNGGTSTGVTGYTGAPNASGAPGINDLRQSRVGTPMARSLDVARTVFFPTAASGDTSESCPDPLILCREKAVILITDGEDTRYAGSVGAVPDFLATSGILPATPGSGANSGGTGGGATYQRGSSGTCGRGYVDVDNSGTINAGDYCADGWTGSGQVGQVLRSNASINAANQLCQPDANGRCTANIRVFVVGLGVGQRNDTRAGVNQRALGFLRDTLDLMATEGGTTQAYFANDARELYQAIADAITRIKEGAYTRSAPVLTLAGRNLYAGFFEIPGWKGHLNAYPINDDGTLGSFLFDAGDQLQAKAANTRVMYTARLQGQNLVRENFVDTNAAALDNLLNPSPGEDINNDGSVNISDAQTIINFIRDPGYAGGKYRGARDANWKLGDIFRSTPVVVGPPFESYTFSNYVAFKLANIARAPTIYIGTNGGTLEAIDAATGEERWAYVPNNLLGRLKDLRLDHRFFVDATPTYADVCVANCASDSATWKTVLISGQRQGGRYYFALDITDPNNPQPLWEFTHPDLGETWSKPAIARVKLGSGPSQKDYWVAFVGGGYDPSNSTTKVFGIDIATGQLLKQGATEAIFDVGRETSKNNIPGAPRAVDVTQDRYVDFVYVGDTEGRLHKIDVRDPDLSNWNRDTLSTRYLVYDPQNDGLTRRSILYAPSIVTTKDDQQRVVLLAIFGTGDVENNITDQNYLYAVQDCRNGYPTQPNRALLWTGKSAGGMTSAVCPEIPSLAVTNSAVPAMYVDVTNNVAEKLTGTPVTYNNVTYFTTFLPSSNPCCPGKGRLWEIKISLASGFGDTTQVDIPGLPSPVALNPQVGGEGEGLGYVAYRDPVTGEIVITSSPLQPSSSRRDRAWREIFR